MFYFDLFGGHKAFSVEGFQLGSEFLWETGQILYLAIFWKGSKIFLCIKTKQKQAHSKKTPITLKAPLPKQPTLTKQSKLKPRTSKLKIIKKYNNQPVDKKESLVFT